MREITLVLGAALTGVLIVAAVLLGPTMAGANLGRPGVPPVVQVIDPSTAAPQPAEAPDATTLTSTGSAQPIEPPTDEPDADSQGALPPRGHDQKPRPQPTGGTQAPEATPRQP
jgi:hypothetical protein